MTADPNDPLNNGFTPEEVRDAERYEAAREMREYLQHVAWKPGRVIEVRSRSHGPKSRRLTIDDCAWLWACGIRADGDIASAQKSAQFDK